MSGKKPYDITISVNTRFLDDQSAPGDNRYAFAYTITIVNEGSVGARLLSRTTRSPAPLRVAGRAAAKVVADALAAERRGRTSRGRGKP